MVACGCFPNIQGAKHDSDLANGSGNNLDLLHQLLSKCPQFAIPPSIDSASSTIFPARFHITSVMSREAMAESEAASSPDSASQSPGDPSTTPGSKKRNSKSSKPRLTPHQKNTNHKDAENKRRTAIRENFTTLSQVVPGTEGQERSEQVMLVKTKEYLVDSIKEIRQLELEAQQRGIPVSDNGRMKDSDYGGPKWKQPNLDKYHKAKSKKASKSGSIQDDADGEAEDE